MFKFQDSKYLLNDQYPNAEKLNVRIRLHVEFSTNDYGWFRWVFDQFKFPDQVYILELGCGPGDLWAQNAHRIQEDWQMMLSDFSAGMVVQARHNLSGHPYSFLMSVGDAQAIPYDVNQFDVVIANHCLYHITDRNRAFSEINRVLQPGGSFFTTTVGNNQLKEIYDLVEQFDPTIEDALNHQVNPYTLESGLSELRKWFSRVRMVRYPDSLHITEAEPLVAYIISTIRFELEESQRNNLTAFLKSQITSGGGTLRIQKDSGLFIAIKA